jgi:hypothetical protein
MIKFLSVILRRIEKYLIEDTAENAQAARQRTVPRKDFKSNSVSIHAKRVIGRKE